VVYIRQVRKDRSRGKPYQPDTLGIRCAGAYDENGEKVWARELDLYGNAIAGDSSFIPFLYQGQYYDEEIGLAYNRFRYYSPDSGTYISQDPIRLAGGTGVLWVCDGL